MIRNTYQQEVREMNMLLNKEDLLGIATQEGKSDRYFLMDIILHKKGDKLIDTDKLTEGIEEKKTLLQTFN